MAESNIVLFIVGVVLTFKKEVSIKDLNTLIYLIEKKLSAKYYLRLTRDIIFYHNELCVCDYEKKIITRSDNFIKPGLDYAKDFIFKDNNDYQIIISEIFNYFDIPMSRIQILFKKYFSICICGSMRASKEMIANERGLKDIGHEVIVPEFVSDYAKLDIEKMHSESAKNKIAYNLIKGYFKSIKDSDAILVVNPEIKGIKNYIGANTFLEMGFAHVLDKEIYVLYDIQENSAYKDEIIAMQPKVLKGDISLIE